MGLQLNDADQLTVQQILDATQIEVQVLQQVLHGLAKFQLLNIVDAQASTVDAGIGSGSSSPTASQQQLAGAADVDKSMDVAASKLAGSEADGAGWSTIAMSAMVVFNTKFTK